MKRNNNNNKINITRQNYSYPETFIKLKPTVFRDSQTKELNSITLDSLKKGIEKLQKSIEENNKKIENCETLESLRKIDIQSISAELGVVEQSSSVDTSKAIKEILHMVIQSFRDLEIAYFNKEIDLLKQEINVIATNSENNIKDIAGSTLFSIASVFLGISLTSSIVSGVQKISIEYMFLFLLTCLLIPVITIGVAAIFMRKFDIKSKVMFAIMVSISVLWGIVAFYTYNNCNSNSSKGAIQSSVVDNNEIVDEVKESNQ